MAKEYALIYSRPDSTFQMLLRHPFHSILKAARERKGLGIRELARKLKWSHVYLIKIERGEMIPSPRRLNELQKELDIDPFFLVPVEELEGKLRTGLHEVGDLNADGPSASFLFGLLLHALRTGGFDPTLGIPTDKDKEQGICACIALGFSRNYEILIREVV